MRKHAPVTTLVSQHRNKDIVVLDPTGPREAVGDVGPDHIGHSQGRVLDHRDPDVSFLLAF
jgi:hypothetical protein